MAPIFMHFFSRRNQSHPDNLHGLLAVIVMILMLATLIPPGQVGQASPPPETIYLPLIQNGDPPVTLSDCPENDTQWLCLLNEYRRIAGVPPVFENSYFTYGLSLHTNYLLLNGDKIKDGIIENFHTEVEGYPGYSEIGKAAGIDSNIVWYPGTGYTVQESMDIWMTYAGHRYGMLHPDLTSSGYDLSCDRSNCAAGLNVQSGWPKTYNMSEYSYVYPASRQINIPTSIEISWSFYQPWTSDTSDKDEAALLDYWLKDGNTTIAVNVEKPDLRDGEYDSHQQIVLIPREPLLSNHTYTVYMRVRFQGQEYSQTWSFTTR